MNSRSRFAARSKSVGLRPLACWRLSIQRRQWPASLPGRFTPKKDTVPINQGARWAPKQSGRFKEQKNRESNLRRLYSDCAVRLLVVDRSGVLSWYLPARTAWKGDTTKILIQDVWNSEQYLKAGPFDLYKIILPCGGGKYAVRPGFQTKTVYALLITPMVLRAPHTKNIWRWTGLQVLQLLSYNFIHSQLQIDIIILFPQALRMFFS